jgi:[acyl-carrier-protein] S-malonyltransferase
MKLACIFTGQGSQYEGMGKSLETFPIFESLCDEFQKSSALPLKQWLFDTSADVLQRTEVAQPIIYFHGYLAYKAFSAVFPIDSVVYAGHSLGEYAALAAAGVLSPQEGLKTVHMRGKLMQEACPLSFGGMAAVMVRNVDDVVVACEQISSDFGEENAITAANFNSERQVVVSGRQECLQILKEKYKDFGLIKVIPLKVSAPFHSKYMTPMKEKFSAYCQDAIEPIGFSEKLGWYVPNVTAELLKISELSSTQVQHLLLEQLDHAVRWDLTARCIGKLEAMDAMIEFGPKAVVGPMMKNFVSYPIYHVGSADDLELLKGKFS